MFEVNKSIKIKLLFMIILLVSFTLFAIMFDNTTIGQIEKITPDGYWWSTLNDWNKLGYVQGYCDAANRLLPAQTLETFRAVAMEDPEKQEIFEKIKEKILSWQPYDKSFAYYWERIDGYYKTTKDMKKLVFEIMEDLFTPMSEF